MSQQNKTIRNSTNVRLFLPMKLFNEKVKKSREYKNCFKKKKIYNKVKNRLSEIKLFA